MNIVRLVAAYFIDCFLDESLFELGIDDLTHIKETSHGLHVPEDHGLSPPLSTWHQVSLGYGYWVLTTELIFVVAPLGASVVAGVFLGGGLFPPSPKSWGLNPPKIYTPKIHCKKGQKNFRAAVQFFGL